MALLLATFAFPSASFAQANIVNPVTNGQAGRSTVLPTDVVPLPLAEERRVVGESFKLRLWQKLPTRFYMNATVETSGRYETNVFQFPTKRTIFNRATYDRNETFGALSTDNQASLSAAAFRSSQADNVYRVTPNITAGWALGPNTRVFANYFYFRDKLARFNSLNTYINQVGAGIEHVIPIKNKASLELQYMSRELWQANSKAVFDYLPSTTLTYYVKPGWVAYFNALAQFRSLHFFGAVNREIDPFFTIGGLHQKGRWMYSANMTYLNNFRHGFKDASVNLNSQTIICDFEIARQLFKKIPGFQAFVRAEPVWNFKTNNTPGLAGMDFRIFYGVRGSISKQPLIATMQQLKQRYQQQEPKQGDGKNKNDPKQKNTTPEEKKPGDGKTEPPKDDNPSEGPSAELKLHWPTEQEASAPEPSPFDVLTLNSAPSAPSTVTAALQGAPVLAPLAANNTASTSTTDAKTAERNDSSPITTDDILLDTAAPMHGFITESGRETADATLISESTQSKQRVN